MLNLTSYMKKLLFLMILVLIPTVSAVIENGHLTLLAVKEAGNVLDGSTADLYLEIKSGSGRVFMETFPLSKLDTQISTRFAKEIACDFVDFDCDDYDFFYTIRSETSIIGGPSAGAAIAVLTSAMLTETPINEDVAITGTINSGGLIGPVGGYRAKVDAAGDKGIKRVLLPLGGRFVEKFNLTMDLKDYADEKYKMQVVEAVDLNDALYHFTGKRFQEDSMELEINEEYTSVMQGLADLLCSRTKELQKDLLDVDKDIIDEEYVFTANKALNLSEKGEEIFEKKGYYSSASYCFGANVRYRELFLKSYQLKNLSKLKQAIIEYDNNLSNKEIKTISDLEAYMIVKERLKEASDSLNITIEKVRNQEDVSKDLAYIIERAYSAETWSEFFGFSGKEFDFDRDSLKDSCISKISEAEERMQYVQLFFAGNLGNIQQGIQYAHDDLKNGDYELCLFRASKAKAEVDVIIGVMGVEEEQIEEILDAKMNAVKDVIAEQQSQGIFPILGYSYYEYASFLRENDMYSALLYSEYALELSKLDMYFQEKEFKIKVDEEIIIFIIGVLGGFLIGLGVGKKFSK